jgi:O-antigen/teichoic acid export membrane protein
MANRKLFKDILSVLSSNVFAVLNGLLVSVILTRTLGPESYGLYAAIIVIPLVVINLTQLGIRASAIFFIGKDKQNLASNISGIMMVLVMTALAGMIIAAVALALMETKDYSIWMMVLVVLFIPMHLTTLYAGGIFLGKEEIKRANFIRWFPVFADLLFVLLFVLLLNWQVEGALLALLLAYLIVAIWSLIVLSKQHKIKPRFNKIVVGRLLKMGIVFALSIFVIQLNFRIDILILKSLGTAKEVGFYSLGVSIAEVLWQIPLAVGIILMSRTANSNDHELMNQTTAKLLRLSLIVAIVAASFLYFLAPFIVPLIWGKDFLPSVILLRTILPGILFLSVLRIISSRLSGMGKPQISLYVFLPALILNIVLNYCWIPAHGALGAAMATNVSYILGAIAFIIVYARVVKMPIRQIVQFQKDDFSFLSKIEKEKNNDGETD